MLRPRATLEFTPRVIAAFFLVFGVAWIAITDLAVIYASETQDQIVQYQALKGWLFVGLASAFIYGLTAVRDRQLARTTQRLILANQQLQVFDRVYRHDFRNKFTLINGYLHRAREETAEAAVQASLERAAASADALVEVCEKLGFLGEIDAHDSPGTRTDLVEHVDRAVARAQMAYPAATIEASLPSAAMVYGDRSIGFVIEEVLTNAIEHNPLPEADRVASVEVVTDGATVAVEVTDNGPGIPPAELAVLGADETQLNHMSGVGLWLASWVCDLHGGAISFDAPPDGGSTVSVRFEAITGGSRDRRRAHRVMSLAGQSRA